MRLALPARAKLNLDLAVVSRRSDGYHDVRTTLQAIDLHDLLVMQASTSTALTASGLGVITDDGNSVMKALRALEQAAGRPLPTAFHLEKRIPSGAGLGGASSDAAAALRGLAALHRLDLDLLPVARTVGADVAFFLAGGRALAEGRGDVLHAQPVDPSWFVVAWPGFEVLTPGVYRAWDEVGGEGPNHLLRGAENVEPRLRDFAHSLGAGWQMTGSGSAFFRRYANRKAAEETAATVRGWRVVAHTVGAW